MFKKILAIILVYLMTIPINYLPYISTGTLKAKKYRVAVIDINAGDDYSFSKRMTQFIKDELETKNRIEYFEHKVIAKIKAKPKKEKIGNSRTYDSSVFNDVKEIKSQIKQQELDKEYAMLIESWLQVIEIYEENFENLETMQELFEAYLNKSYYEGFEEMDKESKENLRQAITIGRNLVFDSSKFSPRFLVKYKRERKRSKKKALGTITLDASNSNELIIDGISMGKAPVKVTDLSLGKHYVVVVNSNKVVKKKIINLTRNKKKKTIKIKSKKKEVKEVKLEEPADLTDKELLSEINEKLSNNKFDEDLKTYLHKFCKKINADFIIIGNSNKKHDLYRAKLYIYSSENRTISNLTKGEFDTDLLTGDVEGLRIGNEVVKGVDNFSSLKAVKLAKKEVKEEKKEVTGRLRTTPFIAYGKLKFNTVAKIETKKVETKLADNTKTVAKTKTVKKEKKNIDLSDADYASLDEDSDLNKYSESKKEEDNDSVLSKWWLWTIVGVVVIGGTAGTVYALSQGEDKATTTPTGTW